MISFGTGGWRHIIGDGFTKSNIQLLAAALCRKMQFEGNTEKGIVIGYDRRFLSKEAMRWLGTVFAAAGIKARLVNESSPTPLIMYYVNQYDLPYGMMVTASHNPAVYNGVKVFTAGGRDADQTQTDEIERFASEIREEEICDMDYNDAIEKGLIEEIYPINEYLDDIISKIDMDTIRKANLKIALDPLYGVSGTPMKILLYTARCRVEVNHNEHDTLFAGKAPTPTYGTMKSLADRVKDYNFDIGVAMDGDADRLGVIDDTGRYLHPNEILVLLYYYLNHYRHIHGPAVRNISTTHILDKIARRFGEECYEVPVGFKWVSSKMAETGAIIGGESSGGLTVKGHIHGKDGIYAAMLLIEMIAVSGKKLSQLFENIEEEYGSAYMEQREYSLTHQKKEELSSLLFEEKVLPVLPYSVEKVSYMDGMKEYFEEGGWISVRFSGTEPLLRIFCEMETQEKAEEICNLFEAFLGLA